VATIQRIYPKQNLITSIVAYTFPENEEMLEYYKEKFEIFNEITDLIKRYYLPDGDE
jgi:hypothetical protein